MSNPFFPVPGLEFLATDKCNMQCTYCFEPDKKHQSFSEEQLQNLVNNVNTTQYNMLGGEPLLWTKELGKMMDAIDSKPMNIGQKWSLKSRLREQITNGTLIPKNIDFIKKYDLTLQISLDGTKAGHDLCRIYPDGAGTYDDVQKGIQACISNNLKWTVHGTVSRATIPLFFEMFKKLFFLISPTVPDVSQVLVGNTTQIIFEDNYTDKDIDELLYQFYLIADWIMNSEEFEATALMRENMFKAWFFKRGSPCVAGNRMMTLTPSMNLYPCHRVATSKDPEKYSIGKMDNPDDFSNYPLYNNFLKLKRDEFMISSCLNIYRWEGILAWMNWCPAANLIETGSPSFQPVKYNTLIAEYNRFVLVLAEYFKVPLPAEPLKVVQSSVKKYEDGTTNDRVFPAEEVICQ